MSNRVGIVGCGFVGGSLREGLRGSVGTNVYDKYNEELSTVSSLGSLVEASDILFVCLPTPMRSSGEADISLVKDTVLEIDRQCSFLSEDQRNKVIVIKSTVPPGTTKMLQEATSTHCNVVFNPEFLTEANHIEDFKNQKRIILGGDDCRTALLQVKKMYSIQFPDTPYILCGSMEAEITKYFCNCFLATKVSFANEMKQLCDSLGADYDKVTEYSLFDDRIGDSHLSVPGPDGRWGFGGSCFPKDINALMHKMKEQGLQSTVLKAAWDKNLEVRPEKDWEKLKGRAVTE